MKAIILAAGRGSRMGKLTDDQPKCLVEISGKNLLDRQIESITRAGITSIAVVTGYKKELINLTGVDLFHNARWAETNMVSSLFCANEWLQEDTCIISYSDIFYDSTAVSLLMESQNKLAITYDPNWARLWEKRFGNPLDDAETFQFNKKNFLTEIGGEAKTMEEIQGQYMGLLRFMPEGWKEITAIRNSLESTIQDKMHMTGLLQRILTTGKLNIEAIPYFGEWGEVDSEEDLNVYNKQAREARK
jgi:L-glutamine-phosphate cytidylyltransferase